MTETDRFITFDQVQEKFSGKTVAIIGSGPSCTQNDGKFIDSHDYVVRIQNYKINGFEHSVGTRTDVHYSFYGTSVTKSAEELQKYGVTLCMCKCPDGDIIREVNSTWHIKNHKVIGVNYRYIYSNRLKWWFSPVYVPTKDRFLSHMFKIGSLKSQEEKQREGQNSQPTTGFACLLDFMDIQCKSVYVTGFDFFTSGIHNVDEKWNERNLGDPLRHRPDLERIYLRNNAPENWSFDRTMQELLK